MSRCVYMHRSICIFLSVPRKRGMYSIYAFGAKSLSCYANLILIISG